MDTPNKELLQAQYMLDLRVYNDEDDEDCSICLDTPKTVVCIPCGHLCCCYGCFSKLPKKQCILCRERIENIKLSMLHSSLIKRCKEDKRVLEIFNIEIPYIQLRGITVFDALSELLELTHSYSNAKSIKTMITAYLNSIEKRMNVLDLIERCTLRRTVKYKVLTATLPKLWLNHYISLYSDDIRSSIETDNVKNLQQILRENVAYEIFDVLFADGDTPLHLAIKHKSYRCMALLVNAELELMDPVEDETFGLCSSFTRVRNSVGLTPIATVIKEADEQSMNIMLKFEALRYRFLLDGKLSQSEFMPYRTSSLSICDREGNNCFHTISLVAEVSSIVFQLEYHMVDYMSKEEASLILNCRNKKGHTPRYTAERYGNTECRKLIDKLERWL